jgi:hypothetical protein
LQSIGFRFDAADENLPSSHHHLRMLNDRETGIGVEIHTGLLNGKGAALIPTDWFCQGTRPFPFRGLQVRLADATRTLAHIVAHDQLLHNNYWRRRFELRQLLDLAMIRARCESPIDWAELDHRFCGMGFGKVLATYLEFAKRLLGQPAPHLRHAPRAATSTGLRCTIDPSGSQRWKHFAMMLIDYVETRRRDPRGVINLFDLARWPERFTRATKAFERNPPSW